MGLLDKLKDHREISGLKPLTIDLGGLWRETSERLKLQKEENRQNNKKLRESVLVRSIDRLIQALNGKYIVGATITRNMPDKRSIRYITQDHRGRGGYVELAMIPSIFRKAPPRYLLIVNGKEYSLPGKQEFEELHDFLDAAKRSTQD